MENENEKKNEELEPVDLPTEESEAETPAPVDYPAEILNLIRTVSDDAELRWRGHTLRLVPLPGHTPGSEGIFLDENTFFCGDYMIQDEEPIVRFPGGSKELYRSITEPFLRDLPKGILICPGHKDRYILQREGDRRQIVCQVPESLIDQGSGA